KKKTFIYFVVFFVCFISAKLILKIESKKAIKFIRTYRKRNIMCFEVNDEEEADKVKEKEEKEKDKDKDKVKQTEEEEEKEKEEAPNTDPYLKYANHDLGVLEEGVSFRIRGKIPNQASV
uniref:Uncharacterized protein n=1 Tax=Glossina brevipalpis TaxID=37001 RepID=A0A1A9W0J2_9MUSC